MATALIKSLPFLVVGKLFITILILDRQLISIIFQDSVLGSDLFEVFLSSVTRHLELLVLGEGVVLY